MLARVATETGVALRVLSGVDESRLTFLAVRRWYGWSAGRIINIDIGGGSLELSSGVDEEPEVALSLPLGAGRLTREWLPDDPPAADAWRCCGTGCPPNWPTRARRCWNGGTRPDRGDLEDVPVAGATHRRRALRRGTPGEEDTDSCGVEATHSLHL